MHESTAQKENKETLNPETVCLISLASQPGYYKGEIDESRPELLSVKRRGDLIIENFKKAIEMGYSVILVYGDNDNQDFIESLNETAKLADKNTAIVIKQSEKTYSGARRDGTRQVEKNSRFFYAVQHEMEKSLEYIPELIEAMSSENADLGIINRGIVTDGRVSNEPEREDEDLKGMPLSQARSEFAFSKWANDFLKKMEIMPKDFPWVDWMGNCAWRNTDKMNAFFTARYEADENRPVFKDMDPDFYSSSLFFPKIAAFNDMPNTKIVSVKLKNEYRHDKTQSDIENKDPKFILKRDRQRKMLKEEMVEFVRLIFGKRSFVKLAE